MLKTAAALVSFLLLSLTSFADEQARFLVTNHDALQARVDLIQQAKTEILAEYFSVWNDDQSVGGMALLMEAAHRGVHVKVIMDALSSKVPDPLMVALEEKSRGPDGRKNLEIKFYNSLTPNLSKLSHRDHAKMLIIDGNILITGGRNVGDKYFGTSLQRNFTDLDVLLKGPVAAAAKDNFLQVWNSSLVTDPQFNSNFSRRLDPAVCVAADAYEHCMSEQSIANSKVLDQEARLDGFLKQIRTEGPGDLVKANTGADWLKGSAQLQDVQLLSHKPDQLVNVNTAFINHDLLAALQNAQSDVIIVAPYFIPTQGVIAVFRDLHKRGVRVRIITNSKISSDNVPALAGYLFLRKSLIDAGLEMYEYSGPDTLHAKTALIDHKHILIGTYNLDRRSALINREVVISIPDGQSSGMAQQLESVIEDFRAHSIIVSKDGVELNGERQEVGVSQVKRRAINVWTLLMPTLINQL